MIGFISSVPKPASDARTNIGIGTDAVFLDAGTSLI